MKIICIGRNYKDHAKEMGKPVPDVPMFFLKPDSALLPKRNPFFIPDFSKEVHYEVELVYKIKKVGKSIVFEFKIENKFSKYLIPKASILINGVSLTISKIIGNNFQIWCIPHTLKLTNLSNLKINDIVNIEIDILSKYVQKFYENKKI